MRVLTEEQKLKRKEYQRRYIEKNREKSRAMKRARYDAHIDKIKAVERERFYRKTYGITVADYDRMLKGQGGKCGICGAEKPGNGAHKNFAVDHCHETGRIRGLLCVRCNVGLGFYEKHGDKFAKYLEDA